LTNLTFVCYNVSVGKRVLKQAHQRGQIPHVFKKYSGVLGRYVWTWVFLCLCPFKRLRIAPVEILLFGGGMTEHEKKFWLEVIYTVGVCAFILGVVVSWIL